MKKVILILLSAIITLALIFGGYALYKINTPEYMLLKTINDVNESGIEGLKKHLTDNALNIIEAVEDIADEAEPAGGIKGLAQGLAQDLAIRYLKSKMAEINWSLAEVIKGKGKADVVIGFEYEDKLKGTIGIYMVKSGREWKIDGLSIPDFEHFSLW